MRYPNRRIPDDSRRLLLWNRSPVMTIAAVFRYGSSATESQNRANTVKYSWYLDSMSPPHRMCRSDTWMRWVSFPPAGRGSEPIWDIVVSRIGLFSK